MSLTHLNDRAELARFLEADPQLNLYLLGDLDPCFWPRTTWYGWRRAGELRALVLIYAGLGEPTVLLSCRDAARPDARALLAAADKVLPRQFHAHFSPGCVDVLDERGWTVRHRGPALRMELVDGATLVKFADDDVERLTMSDLEALQRLYQSSYPEGWFDPRMLETGHYFGIRQGAELLSAAGVHVFSTRYGVASLGNITTAASVRRQGLSTRTTARLCRDLLDVVPHVGLNVRAANTAALGCYRKLGFRELATFDEYRLTAPR